MFYQYCDCWIYFQVKGCSLLQNRLPVSQSFSDGEAGDHAVDLGPPFAHVVLNVKHKRLLAKISIYYLPWSLQPYCGVQVRLKWETEKEKDKKRELRDCLEGLHVLHQKFSAQGIIQSHLNWKSLKWSFMQKHKSSSELITSLCHAINLLLLVFI